MSSVSRVPPAVLANALRATRHLHVLSIRYVASDDVIRAIGESDSRCSIEMMDVSFGSVTDEAVEGLINRAQKLSRLNLRGCRSISANVHNCVHVEMERKRTQGDPSGEAHHFSIPKAGGRATRSFCSAAMVRSLADQEGTFFWLQGALRSRSINNNYVH